MPKEDEDRHRKEFEILLNIFKHFLNNTSDDMEPWEVMEELMSLRAEFAIHYAFDGFGLDYEKALELLRSSEDGLSESDKAKRDIIVAAVDNLVDFAVAEEYQMAEELKDLEDDELDNDEDSDDYEAEEYDEIMAIFSKYNDRYALVENHDVMYAMSIAAYLSALDSSTVLTYTTMGDERVRPWHLQYEGYSAPKAYFPAWLVPPIEHACRCYLTEDSVIGKISEVQNARSKTPNKPEWFNPTFKESVAFGGRIFSDEHPYFNIKSEHLDALTDISNRIKSIYING